MRTNLRIVMACVALLLGSLPLMAQAPTLSGLSASPNPVCAGSPVSFTATVGNVTEYRFTLTNGAGSMQNGETTGGVTRLSLNLIASGSGNQTYTLTITAPGGTTSATTNLTVKPLPNASFTGLAGPYCVDAAAVTLTPTTAGGTFSGPGVSGNTFRPANAGTGGSITYTLTVDGCTNSSSQSVSVKPVPNASFTGLATSYCGDAAALTLTPTTAGGTFSGPGVSGTTFTPANASTGGTITYTIPADGCPGSSTSQSVTVKPVPNAGFTGLVGPYCADAAAVTLTPTTAGGTFGGPGVSGTTFTPANAGSGGTITYTLTVDGCTNSRQQSVIVKPFPDASFTGLAGLYCTDAAAITLTPTTPGGSFNGQGVSGNTFTPANAGSGGTITYTVTVDGCTNINQQSVTVNALPTVNAGADKSVVLGFGGANSNCTDLAATAAGGSGAGYTYAWNPGDLSGQTVNVCPQETMTYTVTVADGNGCTATGQVTVNVQDVRCGNKKQNVTICYYGVTQCVSEKIAQRYLKLGATLGACSPSVPSRMSYEPAAGGQVLSLSVRAYPNPTTGRVTVVVQSPVAGPARFEVLNAGGLAVQHKAQALIEGRNEVPFELGAQPAGNYLIRCVDGLGRQAVVRVNKQ